MELNGIVKVIGAEQQVSASFKKRELVIVTEEQYPATIMIEFNQDKTDLLNGLQIGQGVKVFINIGGREWVNPQGETKYFNSIKGWKIEKKEVLNPSAVDNYQAAQVPAQTAAQAQPQQQAPQQQQPPAENYESIF